MAELSLDTILISLAGGVMIGLSAVMLMALNGRIAGISGIVGGLVNPSMIKGGVGQWGWRLAFVTGLVASPLLYGLVAELPVLVQPRNIGVIILGGLIVGFGTRLGGGCTSGHGVCGMARLSQRSIVATVTFMLTGFATVYVFNMIGG